MNTIVMFNLSWKTNTLLPVVWNYASYWNRNHVNRFEDYYATTTPIVEKPKLKVLKFISSIDIFRSIVGVVVA